MTRVFLLENLKSFTEESVQGLILPVKPSEEVEEPEPRAPAVYAGHLPEFDSVKRKAPCILHQLVTSKDVQRPGDPRPKSSAVVRTAFCVYNENEEEGGLMLLNLMERLRIALLRKVVIAKQFKLDLEAGLDVLIYDTAGRPTHPYYLGEMISVWKLPYAIEREVPYGKERYSSAREPDSATGFGDAGGKSPGTEE